MWTRRDFLRGAGLAGGAAFCPGWLRGGEAADGLRTVSLFHTTDLHGHILPTQTYDGVKDVGGLARCAARIRAWRKESPHSLLLDIGDVYQGTAVGWLTRGRLMVDLFNKLGYDGWVLGNHEFDWGPEVVLDALQRSVSPVLTGNMMLDGRPAGSWDDPANPFSKVLPHIVREVGGVRIGVIGTITPGLPYWLRPELLTGFEVLDPGETLRNSVRFLRGEAMVDAVVVCGHMGWRDVDDFANRTRQLLAGDSGVDVYLGGHTHRNHPSREVGGTLYTQADYFGIHCGRVDLTFDLESRKLVAKRAVTALMDARIEADPVVLAAAKTDLGEADAYLAAEVGVLAEPLGGSQPHRGAGSPLQNLFGAAFEHAAKKAGLKPEGVFHGTFGTGDWEAGTKAMADIWKVLPYENRLVALCLTREELIAVCNEAMESSYSDRALYGFDVKVAEAGPGKGERWSDHFVRSLRSRRNPEAPADHRFCVLFNAYDAQSGGKRLMRLRTLSQQPECRATLLPLSSREALIDFFKDREVVRPGDVVE